MGLSKRFVELGSNLNGTRRPAAWLSALPPLACREDCEHPERDEGPADHAGSSFRHRKGSHSSVVAPRADRKIQDQPGRKQDREGDGRAIGQLRIPGQNEPRDESYGPQHPNEDLTRAGHQASLQYVARPPDKSNTAPVVKEFSAEASHATMPAISRVSTKRARGILDSMKSICSLLI